MSEMNKKTEEWLTHRLAYPLVPIFFLYIACKAKHTLFTIPPFSIAAVACFFPLIVMNDYKKEQFSRFVLVPLLVGSGLFFLAVIQHIEQPEAAPGATYFATVLWLFSLVVNFLRLREKIQ
jgi:hypothetical protein